MKHRIKFLSNYPKLHNQEEAKLLSVRIVSFFDLDNDLIEYDTQKSDGSYYTLPKTTLLHLTFLGDKLIPFCTLRRYTIEKYRYYKSLIGKTFKIVYG